MLSMAMPVAQALDDSKYPDWKGLWERIGGGSFDPSKRGGRWFRSVHADPDAFRGLAEPRIFFPQQLGHFGLAAAGALGALLLELFLDLRQGDELGDGRVELVDDRLRRAVRHEDRAPADGVIA